jgi:hypothetical protein
MHGDDASLAPLPETIGPDCLSPAMAGVRGKRRDYSHPAEGRVPVFDADLPPDARRRMRPRRTCMLESNASLPHYFAWVPTS